MKIKKFCHFAGIDNNCPAPYTAGTQGDKMLIRPSKKYGIQLHIVAAIGDNRELGQNGTMPWFLQNDLQSFSIITGGARIIMGRKTHESILKRNGTPLRGRKALFVLTRTPESPTRDYGEIKVNFTSDLEAIFQEVIEDHERHAPFTNAASRDYDAAELCHKPEPIMVIGGGEIYALTLPIADKMWLTRVHGSFPDADAFFPAWDESEWQLESRHLMQRHPKDTHDSSMELWCR